MHVALAVLVLATAVSTQTPADSLAVESRGRVTIVPGATLDSLSTDSVTASFPERPATRYRGCALYRLFGFVGDALGGQRGRQFERVPVVEAEDGYRMAFGAAELDPSVTGRAVLLVRASGPDGPWRLVV